MDNNNMFDSEDLTGSFDTNDIEQNKAISAIGTYRFYFLFQCSPHSLLMLNFMQIRVLF